MNRIDNLDLSFLDNIEIEDKETIIKSISFNKNEQFMLKYVAYKDKKFASYVKELILEDIKKHLKKDDDEHFKNLIRQILREEGIKTEVSEEIIEDVKEFDNHDKHIRANIQYAQEVTEETEEKELSPEDKEDLDILNGML